MSMAIFLATSLRKRPETAPNVFLEQFHQVEVLVGRLKPLADQIKILIIEGKISLAPNQQSRLWSLMGTLTNDPWRIRGRFTKQQSSDDGLNPGKILELYQNDPGLRSLMVAAGELIELLEGYCTPPSP